MEGRLITEQKNIRKNRNYLFYAHPLKVVKNNVVWECGFPGPDSELYKGSYYVVELTFNKDYPYSPPRAQFINKVYHPNVYTDRRVCLDVLAYKWKPSMTVSNVLCALQHLLETPNIKSPANTQAAYLYRTNNKKYQTLVNENIMKFHNKPTWKKITLQSR